MTPDERAALREKAAAAVPGPWEYRHNHPTPDGEGGYYEYDTSEVLLGEDSEFGFQVITALHADAEYIAAVSPSVVLSLLDALEAVTAKHDALAASLAEAPHASNCGSVLTSTPFLADHSTRPCTCWKSKLPAHDLAARDADKWDEGAGYFAREGDYRRYNPYRIEREGRG